MKKLLFLLAVIVSTTLGAIAQNRTVSGVVLDADTDEPLIGASVKPVGGGAGVATDVNGRFTISIPTSVKELEFSYVGMETKKVPVSDKMTVLLSTSSTMLDQVIVTGYGSAKKIGSVVGSVAVVGEKQLENITTPSFLDALQGQVSGLSIASASGDPSSTENDVRIRGLNSLNSSNTPLFILDGAPVTQTVFSTLNPNDIESITVLKDASSVALYGSRAANGVIVITSKKSKFGEQAKVTFRAKYGWSQLATDNIEMMDAYQFIQYRDLIGNPVPESARYAVEKLGVNTDWKKEIYNSHAPTYSVEAAINGGTEHTKYYVSLNHLDQEGIMAQSGMRRETLRFSLDTRANKWFYFGLQANLGYTKYETNSESGNQYTGSTSYYATNPSAFALTTLPYDSPYYYTINEDGTANWLGKAQYLHYSQMPTPDYINENRKVMRTRVTANAAMYEMIRPIKGLTIRAQQAIDAYDSRISNQGFPQETLYTPMGDVYAHGTDVGKLSTGYAQQTFGRYYQFTYTNTAEYKFSLKDIHNISVLLGQETILSKSHSFGVFSQGHVDGRQLLLSQATSVSIGNLSESIAELVMNSWFANLNYDFDNRYFFDFNFRRDGSSRFAPGHRWANFFSVGGMWNLKNESFMDEFTWIDNAKVRVSYGTTGNSSFANYAYQELLDSGPLYNGSSSLGVAQAANPTLSWETVHSFDAGFNVGFLNRFNVDFDFYVKNTRNMLMDIPLSPTSGADSSWGNVGSMRNLGVDLDLRADIIKTKDWYWALRCNLNYNKNTITGLYDGLDEVTLALSKLEIGRPAYEYYMVRYAGVDPRDGMQMWYTKEGNLTKEYNRDRDAVRIEGKTPLSPIHGGFGTDLRWKGLSLRVDFNWAANKWMRNADLFFITDNNMAAENNQRTCMLNVWTTPGQITDIPRVGETIQQGDTRWLEDASYLRLKNLTLAYNLPQNICDKAGLQGVTFHFTGRNLLTFTGFTGYDPEPETSTVFFFYPNTRQYEFGLGVTF